MSFTDRQQAGERLAEKLAPYRGLRDVVLLGLARGGVVVASTIASRFHQSPDVCVVKKIGSPFDSELAIGAVAPEGVSYVDWRLSNRMGADEEYIKKAISLQLSAISEKTRLYRKGKKPFNLKDKTVILVDDGAATGATLEAAIKWLRVKKAKKIVVALPVAAPDVAARIKPEVSELVVLETPKDFHSVGQYYQKFPQVEDGEVIRLLNS